MSLLAHQDTKPRRLSTQDWIKTGLNVLVEDGIDAVQITALARRLKVTRGSFYWHFETREALLDTLLDEWRARNTSFMVDAIAQTTTLDEAILALFDVWTDHRRFDPQLDQAIRTWGRYADALRKTVQAEDDARVAAISDLFERHGFEQPEAFIRARVIYFTQLSYYALNVQEPMADRMGYLAAYFRTFTGRDIDPEIVATQTAKFLKDQEQ